MCCTSIIEITFSNTMSQKSHAMNCRHCYVELLSSYQIFHIKYLLWVIANSYDFYILTCNRAKATGTAEFVDHSNGKIMSYNVNVSNIDKITMVNINQGKKGENGPVVVNLIRFKSLTPSPDTIPWKDCSYSYGKWRVLWQMASWYHRCFTEWLFRIMISPPQRCINTMRNDMILVLLLQNADSLSILSSCYLRLWNY